MIPITYAEKIKLGQAVMQRRNTAANLLCCVFPPLAFMSMSIIGASLMRDAVEDYNAPHKED